jgi:AraC-like DNA-binding protein
VCIDGMPGAVLLAAGDLLMLPLGEAHVIQDCSLPVGRSSRGIRNVTMTEDSPATIKRPHSGPLAVSLLCGMFQLERGVPHPLLDALPRMIVVRAAGTPEARAIAGLLNLMSAEVSGMQAGMDSVLCRLADVLFINVIRYWVAGQTPGVHKWLSALHDPQIGTALNLIHKQPATGWTVALLARRVALSRSAFAKRFTDLVGEPPLEYLTRWRMGIAAHLLRDRKLGLLDVGARVGYDSDVSFSRAFKRHSGQSPSVFRATSTGPHSSNAASP